MVNRSKLITSIKMKLGIHGLSLPGIDINELIEDVINEETLMVFNELLPNMITVNLDTRQLKQVKSSFNETVYIIPDIFGGREIFGIDNIVPYDKYANDCTPYTSGLMNNMGALMMGQVSADLYSLLDAGFSFNFESPNRLTLYNLDTLYTVLTVKFRVEHAKNLSTIPKTAYSSFKKLALLDTKIILYENLKHYSGIDTVHGRIDLKIDDWANAQSERDDLVKEWEDTYHFNGTQLYYM